MKQNGKYLVTKRPENGTILNFFSIQTNFYHLLGLFITLFVSLSSFSGLLAGLWEFPSEQIQPKTTEENTNRELAISEVQLRKKCQDYLKTTFSTEAATKDLIPCGQVSAILLYS